MEQNGKQTFSRTLDFKLSVSQKHSRDHGFVNHWCRQKHWTISTALALTHWIQGLLYTVSWHPLFQCRVPKPYSPDWSCGQPWLSVTTPPHWPGKRPTAVWAKSSCRSTFPLSSSPTFCPYFSSSFYFRVLSFCFIAWLTDWL